MSGAFLSLPFHAFENLAPYFPQLSVVSCEIPKPLLGVQDISRLNVSNTDQ